jgi:hypothetical protein
MPEAMRKLKDFEDRGSLQEKPTELWNLSHEALVALMNCPSKKNIIESNHLGIFLVSVAFDIR